VGFLVNLRHRKSFSPDAAFYVGTPQQGKFLDGAPLFAVEVRSEEDYGPTAEKRLASKQARRLLRRRDPRAAGRS
jgi:Uma2 family endonuclease